MAGSKADWVAEHAGFNAIKRYLALPCSVPKTVYAEAAFNAALKLLWSYKAPDPRHLYHKAFGTSTLCEVKGILKQAIPIASDDHGELLRTAFKASEIADVFTWYFFIASILTDFGIDAADGVVKMKPCSDPAQGRRNSGFAPFGASFSSGRWGTFDFNFDDPHNPAGPCGVLLRPGQGCIVAASCTGTDVGGVEVPLATRILRQSDGAVLDYHQGGVKTEQGIAVGYNASHVWTKYVNTNASVGLELIEWQCTCPNALPDDEVFPGIGSCYRGFIF